MPQGEEQDWQQGASGQTLPSEPADNTRPEQTPTRTRLVAIAYRVVSIHRGCSSFMSKNAPEMTLIWDTSCSAITAGF